MKKIELLAPAKDADIGIAAINCGADAVYIGSTRFGARESAGNKIEDIEKLCRYAHKYWAKVYVTLNTLFKDDEITEALKLISQLHETGIDALIIQDMGLSECDLPPIPLFASTQMHNNNPEKVAFLEKAGFQRVILARELNSEQIREIRKNTVIDLEFFVHGALCVSYSGQCYMSYALGGRSGNRGQCAQPCRRIYSLTDSNGRILAERRYLLSLKDLNLSEHLRELIEAGISSFKIEGRLKDKNYVMNIVSFYRQKLDIVLNETGLKKSSSGRIFTDFIPDPYKTFNRGYTTYFFKKRDRNIAALNTPKSVGEKIGKAVSVLKDHFIIDAVKPLHNGDGICFSDKNDCLHGTAVNKADGKKVWADKMSFIEKGTMIYRNHDKIFSDTLKKSRTERKTKVVLKFSETSEGFMLSATDEDNISVSVLLSCEKKKAEKKEQAMANIQKQLSRFGGTEFFCNDFISELSEPYFIPVSELNALRRSVLEKLTSSREQNRPIETTYIVRNNFTCPETELSYLGNVLNKKAEAFYRRHGVTKIMPAAETGLDMRGKKVMTSKYCIKYQIGLCSKKNDSKEYFFLTDEEGRKFRLNFNCEKCETYVELM